MESLAEFLAFIGSASRIGAKNPLETLDLLYSQILGDIPEDVFPKTRRILYFGASLSPNFSPPTAQELCNFLDMDQCEFYNALRQLHSVLNVPLPEEAPEKPLRMFHTSFRDYLRNPVRSGRFFISEREANLEHCKQCLFWSKIVLDTHCSDGELLVESFHIVLTVSL